MSAYGALLSKVRRSSVIAAAICMAQMAAAEPEKEPADIVVTAIPQKPKELATAVNRFVRGVAQVTDQSQLARRSAKYCAAVSGLDEKYVPVVLDHVRDAASAAGIAAAAPGCSANLAIIFSTDGDGLVAALSRASPNLFRGLSPMKAKEIFASGRAVRWWYGKQGSDADGTEAIEGVLKSYSAGLISTNFRVNISGTIVIVDVTKAEGYPLDAIASYAAMISFAEVTGRQDSLADVPSVLGMFARSVPRAKALKGLTAWDHAYLKALYAIPAERPSFTQRRRIVGVMRKELSGIAQKSP